MWLLFLKQHRIDFFGLFIAGYSYIVYKMFQRNKGNNIGKKSAKEEHLRINCPNTKVHNITVLKKATD